MIVLVALLALSESTAAGAQTVAEALTADLRDAGKDMASVWASPFRAGARDWASAVGVLGVSAAASLVDPAVDRWATAHRDAAQFRFLKPVRQGGAAFAGNTAVPFALVAYGAALATNNRPVRDAVMGCASSYASESVARTQVVYRLISRARPDTVTPQRSDAPEPPPSRDGTQYGFDTPGSERWILHSFPGGHVANIVSCVTFLARRFHVGYAEPAMYAVAAGVGLGRALDRAHWTSDQVIGAFVGYAIGRQVAARSLARARRDSTPAGASAAPLDVMTGSRGITFGWHWTF